MDYSSYIPDSSTDLAHHGIKGQKWGVRRFVDANGHLTPEGLARYNKYIKKYGRTANFSNKVRKLQRKGMSQEEAVIRAGRAKRNAHIAEGAAVAATAAFMAGMYAKTHAYANKDQVFKAGDIMGTRYQRGHSTVNGKSRIFINGHKNDDAFYGQWVGRNARLAGQKAYKLQIKATKDVKVASLKSAEKEYDSFVKAHGIKDALGYRDFNANDGMNNTPLWQQFEHHMQKKGYGGVLDANDTVGQGLKVKNAYILFGNGNNATVNAVKEQTDKAFSSANAEANRKMIGRGLAGSAAFLGTYAAAYGGMKNIDPSFDIRSKHPQSQKKKKKK